jgi:hypothetical protein
MYYEINVAKKITKDDGMIPSVIGQHHHFFATAKRSITDEKTLKKVYHVFRNVFPEPEYKIDITRWEEIGHGVDPMSLLKKLPKIK